MPRPDADHDAAAGPRGEDEERAQGLAACARLSGGPARRCYRLRGCAAGDGALAPMHARIELEPDGQAYLVLDGRRAIRADTLETLLGQVRLHEGNLEAEEPPPPG